MMLGNVMLLDDDAYCNKMNMFVIEQHQAAKSIVTFEAAQQALDYLEKLVADADQQRLPDVILLDLHMSYMDGWGFLDQFSTFMSQYGKKVSIYILTSSIQAADKEAAVLHELVSGYIEKPFTSSELHYVISEQLIEVAE